MLKVGLTGGMACGKSFVAAALARLGCHVIEADDVGHEVMEPGGEAYDASCASARILETDTSTEHSLPSGVFAIRRSWKS